MKGKKRVLMKSRSSSGAWSEHYLPAWLDLSSLREAREEFHRTLDRRRLGLCPRTSAFAWISRQRPEWLRRLGTGFEEILVSFALCLEDRAVRFKEEPPRTGSGIRVKA
jgi:hypothetical protein